MPDPSRRDALALAATAAVCSTALGKSPPARKGNIRHSLVSWCFQSFGQKWDTEKLCGVAKWFGCESVELIGRDQWPTLQKHGLTCAIAGNEMPGRAFMRGFNNPRHRAELVGHTKTVIEACAAAGVPSVIGFVGYEHPDPENPASGRIPRDEAERECLTGLKEVAGFAEKHGVTLCIEHLNTRDASDPMKGHPGYQGDDLDWLAGILRKLGSPRVKLLFDVYHVQIMHGDIVRRLEQCKDLLGHVHTAGNPGRGELDDTQEIAYPAVMRQLLKLGYKGFVGHEFIPTRDPVHGVSEAVAVCDV